jgi:hypothetical protein
LVDIVDAAVGRVVPGLPVPALEEILADPLVLEIEGRTGASYEKEQKKSGKRIASTHPRDTLDREGSKESGF